MLCQRIAITRAVETSLDQSDLKLLKMAMHYNPSGSWYNYNFYGAPNQFPSPGAQFPRGQFNEEQITEEDLSLSSSSQFDFESSHISRESASCESEPNVILCKAMTLKVLSQSNKRDFTVFTLRDVTQDDMQTPDSVKSMIFAQVRDAVSDELDFPLGYYRKSEKVWINNEHDIQDAIQLMKEQGKVMLWCVGLDRTTTARKRDRNGEDLSQDTSGPPKKKSASEERASRVNDLKAQLRRKHGPVYAPVQYAMWAEMIVGGGHDSMDEPPPTPMFGAARARGRTNAGVSNMTEAFTALAGSLAEVISPKQANSDSPTKAVNLRGKYIQQLKELVNLHDIGALTEDEYQEHRSAVVNLMRKLN